MSILSTKMNGSGRKEEPLYNGPSAYPKGSSMKMAILGLSAICSSTLFGCSRDGNDDGNNDGPNNGGPNDGGDPSSGGDEDPDDCKGVDFGSLFGSTARVGSCLTCVGDIPDDPSPSQIQALAGIFDSDCGGENLPVCALDAEGTTAACQECLEENDLFFCMTDVSVQPDPEPPTDSNPDPNPNPPSNACQYENWSSFFDGTGPNFASCTSCIEGDNEYNIPTEFNTDSQISILAVRFQDLCGGALVGAPCAIYMGGTLQNPGPVGGEACGNCISRECGLIPTMSMCRDMALYQDIYPVAKNVCQTGIAQTTPPVFEDPNA